MNTSKDKHSQNTHRMTQKQLALWSSKERTCLHLLEYTTTTKPFLLQIHAFMLRNSIDNNKQLLAKFIATCSSLAAQRFNTNLIRHGRQLFDHMPHKEDTFICNTMMKSYLGIRQYDECLILYNDLRRRVGFKPDDYTFLTLVKLCTTSGLDVFACRQVHGSVVKEGFGFNLFVSTSLVDMYSKLGRMECAKQVFDEMPERNQVTWTALVGGYAKCGEIDNARTYFDRMPKKDTAAFNAMIDAYVKSGDMRTASSLFNEMIEKNVVSWTNMIDGYCNQGDVVIARAHFDAMPVKNLISWNAMIKGYYQNKQPEEAIKLFHELQSEASLKPDNITIVSVLPAIADLGALDLGNWVHRFVMRKKMDGIPNVRTALIDMYAKCGEFTKARKLFDSMPAKGTATWNALIHGLAVNGYGHEALDAFSNMTENGTTPNEITMIAVLTACNHCGLVEVGKRWFESMQREFKLSPTIEHYGCMIDLLGRAGWLEEAEEIMDNMPFEVNEIILSSILSSCGYANDIERAERILRKSHGKGFWNDGNYITLRNLYAIEKRWVDVEGVKEMMSSKNARKEMGCSVIEVGGESWGFASGDQKHPQWKEIDSILGKLLVHMKKAYLTNMSV